MTLPLLQLVEPPVAALKARLEDQTLGIAAAAVLINAANADAYTIDPPKQVLDYVPPAGLVYDYPTVAIGHGRGIFEDDSGWSATGQYDLMVVCFLQDSDPQALATRIRRYLRAAASSALYQRKLTSPGGDQVWSVQFRWVDYGEALPERPVPDDQPPHSFVAFGGVGIQLRQDES